MTLYPGLVCRRCDERAGNSDGDEPYHNSEVDGGDNPIFIDGFKCVRRYRFGGFVTMKHDLLVEASKSDQNWFGQQNVV